MAHELIGALVGIARATEGNEDQFTDEMAFFLARALALCDENESHHLLLKEADAIKRSLVPDCFFCSNPCGRRANYDLKQMDAEPEIVADAKKKILSLAKKLGKHFLIEDASLLLDALIMVGLDVEDPEYLYPTLAKLQERIG